MTYELGRANFIIQFSADQALRDQAEYYHDTTKQAQDLTKFLAAQLKVRQSDVKNAASVLIAEEKRVAAEEAKIAKALADDRKKTTQEMLRYNQQVAKQEEQARKERARSIVNEEKLIEKERLESVKRQVNEEAIIRKRGEAQRKEAAAAEAAAARGGIAGTGLSATRLGGTASTLLGFGAIGSAALIAHEAIVGLTKATLDQEQAQRSLNASFGATNILYKENAEALAKQFNLITSEVTQATTVLGVLQHQTNLTGEQIRGLSAIAIDNRAAFGGDLREAHRSLAGVILGETEAYEKYGLVLQDDVLKASDLLTESERRRFTTMSESEKQMIRYRLVTEHWAEIQGAGTQRVQEAQGGFDKLNKAVNEVAISMGKDLVDATAKEAGALADFITSMSKATKELQLFDKAREELIKESGKSVIGIAIDVATGGADPLSRANIEARAKEIAAREDEEKNGFKRRMAAIAEEEQRQQKALNDQRSREEAEAKRKQELLEIQLRASHDAEVRRIDDLKRAAEERKAIELESLDAAKTAELQRIEDVENARKAAHVEEVARIKKETDDAITAAEDRKRSELERIETEQKATKAAAEENIRRLKIESDALKKASEDRRDVELERLETEKEARDRARTVEDRTVSDSITQQERALDDAHQRALRRIEREGEALHRKNQRALQAIEDQERKEDERHRKALRRIDDEANAAQKAIDQQIAAIEAVQRARENARRSSDLNRRLEEAQLGLRQATGSGDPVAAAAAQQKLTAAIRIGDPVAIKKAQDELIEIVGHGDAAIRKAQEDLSDAQEDIRDNDLKSAEDAQKEKLQQEKERIRETSEREKEEEDDRNRRRRDRLDKDKDSEKKRLQDALDALEKRKEKEDDSNKDAKRRMDDLVTYNRRKLEDRRKDEDQANKDAVEAAQNRYKTEQDDIQETYFGEDHGYIPAIKRALDASNESYDGMREAAETRYRTERTEIEATNTAALAALAKQETEQSNAYTRLVQDTRNKFEEMRTAVEEKYRAKDGKSGILDQYDEMKRVAQVQLDAIMQSFKEHKLGLTGENGVITLQWADATSAAKSYFDYVDAQLKEMERRERERARRNTSPPTSSGGSQYPNAPGDVPGGGGSGTSPQPKPPVDSGPPVERIESHEVDMSPDRYTYRLGFAARYNGNYAAGAGWEEDGRTAAWPNGPTRHKGQDLVLPKGSPVGAFVSGRVVQTHKYSGNPQSDPGGNYIVIQDGAGKTHWYMHLSAFADDLGGKAIHRGTLIGYLGDTGTEDINYPHLHYEVRNGLNNGAMSIAELGTKSIDPGPYIKGRDSGYTFQNPTIYRDMLTGDRGVLAERGPEMLLGRQATRQAQRMGISATARPNVPSMDYMSVGARLAHPGLTGGTINNVAGDTMNYYGVAPEDVMNQWRADQRRQRVLRGRANVTR